MKNKFVRVIKIFSVVISSVIFFTACHKDNPSPAADFSSLDSAIKSKMNQHAISGLSLAIAKDDKLVYAKSYGLADKEANQLALTNDLYRIGTLSQELTAIAILKLVQEGKLDLSQTVFGANGILGFDYGTPPSSSNIGLITVQHLLDHKSGWTNAPLVDLLQWNADWNQYNLITSVVENWQLTYQPGTVYYKLNFGYVVLGRVIQKVTGSSYEDYVKKNLLAPSGITSMRIGGNTLTERYSNEVKYYLLPATAPQDQPYSAVNLKLGDAAIGWVASSSDLARFMMLIDGDATVPDIISSSLLNQHSHFGLYRWTNSSTMAGSNNILSKLDNDFSFSVLTNASNIDGNTNATILSDLNNTITTQIYAIPAWPGSKAVSPYAGDYPAGTYRWSYRRWDSIDTTTVQTASLSSTVTWEIINDTKFQFSGGYAQTVGINAPYALTFTQSTTGELSNFNVTIDPSLTGGLTAKGVTITQAPAIMKMTLTPTKKYFKIWYRVKNSSGLDRTLIDEYWMP